MDENARITDLRKKLEKDPGSRLFAQLAEELRKDGKSDEAITVARDGLSRIPNYPSARLTLARALLDSGQTREGKTELEQIVKASPDNILAGRLLGEALESLGEMIPAIKQYEKTLALSPGDKVITEKLGALRYKPTRPAMGSPKGTPSRPPSPLPAALRPPPPTPSAFAAPAASAGQDATLLLPATDAPAPPSVFDAPVAAPSVFDAPAVVPSVFDAPAAVPSVFDAPAAPSVFDSPAVPSVFDAPAVPMPPAARPPVPPVSAAPRPASPTKPAAQAPVRPTASAPPPPPMPVEPSRPVASTVALDRDLASGTFSPGSLSAAELQKHFEAAASADAEAQTVVSESDLPDIEDTVGFGELERAQMSPELPSIDVAPPPPLPVVATAKTQVFTLPEDESPEPMAPEFPPEDPDVGGQTLPLRSLTLADLYLQQGLKAEANAVLSQVVRDEPENAEARSRLAASVPSPPIEEAVEHFADAGLPVVESVSAPVLSPPPVPELHVEPASRLVPEPRAARAVAGPPTSARIQAPTPAPAKVAAPSPAAAPKGIRVEPAVPMPSPKVAVASTPAPTAPAPTMRTEPVTPKAPPKVAVAPTPAPATPTPKKRVEPVAPKAALAPTSVVAPPRTPGPPTPAPAAASPLLPAPSPKAMRAEPAAPAPPAVATAPKPAPPVARAVAAPAAPSYRSARARIRERTILSLKAFQSAAEREAMQQRASELSSR